MEVEREVQVEVEVEGFRCTSETIVRCTSEYHAAWASSRNLRSSLSSLDTPCRLRRRQSRDESLDIDADRARLLLFLFERSWITSTIKDKASNMGTLPGVKPPLLPPFPWRCQDCPKPFQERFLCQEDPFPSFSITPSCKGAGRLQNQQPAKQRKHGQPQCQGALPSCTIERCPAALPS